VLRELLKGGQNAGILPQTTLANLTYSMTRRYDGTASCRQVVNRQKCGGYRLFLMLYFLSFLLNVDSGTFKRLAASD
jgi:hypothetical protein